MQYKLLMENWRRYLLDEQVAVMTGFEGGTSGGVYDPWEDYKKKLRTRKFRQPFGNDEADTIELLEQRCQKGDKRSCQRLQRMKDRHAGISVGNDLKFANMFDFLLDFISIFDPTRLTAYPAAAQAIANFKKKQNWYTSTMLTLSLLAIVPVIGNVNKVGGLMKSAKVLSKALGKVTYAPKVAGYGTKIESARQLAQGQISKTSKEA